MLISINNIHFIVILCMVIAVIISFIINYSLLFVYRSFIKKHSLSYKLLKELNKKYSFNKIKKYCFTKDYDNQHYFYNVSTRQYLIYSLKNIINDVDKQIDLCIDNKEKNKKYRTEIKSKCVMNEYDKKYKFLIFPKLNKLEKKMCNEILLKPVIELKIKVKLYLYNMGGRFLDKKEDEFSQHEIEAIIDLLLQNKKGYYFDSDIRESINIVEHSNVSNRMRFAIYKRDNYRCRICGRKTEDLEIDHIYPVSRGGKTTYENLQTLCHTCNLKKGNKVNVKDYRYEE